MFRKVDFLKISRGPFLTSVAGLQCTVCKATKNGLLTKFLKCTFKLKENIQEVISNEVPSYQKFTDLPTAAFSLACF